MILIEILDGISIEGPVGNGVLDVPYSATLTARNGTLPVVWEVDGLPEDFDWTDNEDGTVTISSDAETVEVIEATVTATDADGVYTTRDLNFRIIALPLIVTGTLADATSGAAYTATLAISGGYQPYASAQVIEGPTGMTAAIDGETVAVGGPISEVGDDQAVRIRVTDDESNTADFVGTIDVAYATAAIVGDFADGAVGEAYESDLQLTGGDGTWSLTDGDGVASGELPAGTALSIVEVSGTHYLRLSGMPIAAFDDSFKVSVDSGDGQTATSEQSIEVSLPSYDDVMAALSPWGYWKLDESPITGGTTEAVDASGNDRHGTYRTGTWTTGDGVFAGSASCPIFDGATNGVVLPEVTLGTLQKFSIVAFLSTTSIASAKMILGGDQSAPHRLFQFRLGSGKLQFVTITPSLTQTQSTVDINDGEDHQVGVVIDPTLDASEGRVKLYIDGSLNTKSTTAITISAGSVVPAIGLRNGYGLAQEPWDGPLDDVALILDALTADDFATLWATRNTP